MVRSRPDPRGMNFNELYKSQATAGPFKGSGFRYHFYSYINQALKAPYVAMPAFFAILSISALAIYSWKDYNKLGGKYPLSYVTQERLFEYPANSADKRHIRGEWNNNFYCWTDSPDCGKDFKQRYFS